ncbi:unnamed protein product [Pleuronectes platessa]|uniref:Uncharacterized protein n=1 Tax=Pleuronectes platessa TaxID=8262 RepID=A0A9N7YGP6_PLEPL|nr:unnamed protein product [Pleuronectes platessa]
MAHFILLRTSFCGAHHPAAISLSPHIIVRRTSSPHIILQRTSSPHIILRFVRCTSSCSALHPGLTSSPHIMRRISSSPHIIVRPQHPAAHIISAHHPAASSCGAPHRATDLLWSLQH